MSAITFAMIMIATTIMKKITIISKKLSPGAALAARARSLYSSASPVSTWMMSSTPRLMPPAKVVGAEARQDRVLDDEAANGVGERAFEAVADLDTHLALVRRHDQQHAVVLVLLADAPLAAELVAVILDRVPCSDSGSRRRAGRWFSPRKRRACRSISARRRDRGCPASSTTRPVSCGKVERIAARGDSDSEQQRRERRPPQAQSERMRRAAHRSAHRVRISRSAAAATSSAAVKVSIGLWLR